MDISSSSSNSPEPAERRPVWGNRRRRSNADYGDALSAQFMTSSYQNMDIFRWEDDDIGKGCADYFNMEHSLCVTVFAQKAQLGLKVHQK